MTALLSTVTELIAAHPNLAYAAVLLLALSESIPVVGVVVPGTAVIVAISALVPSGIVTIWPLLIAAVAGAIIGDGLSFGVGHHYHRHILSVWPLNRYPSLIARSKVFFASHGDKSVFLARFTPGIRAFVPLLAGVLRMRPLRFYAANLLSVAKGAASVVLTTEGLSGILDLVKNGRAIYQRVLTWIVNKVSRTILKSGFVVVAFLVTGKFVISALGMVLILFMTDFVKIALSTDRVRPSSKPETWNIDPLVKLAVLQGVAMLIEALGLLAFGWREFDLGSHPGQLQTFTFQTLLFFALFSIVSIRERRPFWASRPSAILGAALIADALLGVLIGAFGLVELRPLPATHTALIVGFDLVSCLGLNDFIKCVFLRRFGWNSSHTA